MVPCAQGVRAWARGGCGARRAALLLEGTDSVRVAAELCMPDSPGKWPRTACAVPFSTHSSLGNLCVQIAKLLCEWQLHTSEDHRCRGAGAVDRESSSRIAIS